jgi:hypothetical protein
MLRLFKVIKELKVYRDYLNIIKKESQESPIWSRRRLRVDWLGRIYTVINLPPEVIFSNDLPKEARPSFVMNDIKPINEYLKTLNLEEVLTVYAEPVKETGEESYLVVYQYVFRNLTWLWLLRFLAEVAIIVFCFVKFL